MSMYSNLLVLAAWVGLLAPSCTSTPQSADARALDAESTEAGTGTGTEAGTIDAGTFDAGTFDAAADEGSDGAVGDCDALLTVPVRVHLFRSTQVRLEATWTPDEARSRLGFAADFWARHCVRLVMESVVTTSATPAGEAAFATAIASVSVEMLRLRTALSAAVPRAALLAPGWNVFVIRDFGAPAVGVFVPDPGVQSIFIAQQRLDGIPLPPWVLAHEFGHSFSLAHHVGPDRARNLMRDDPHALTEPVELTPEQVQSARAQAASGSPRGG